MNKMEEKWYTVAIRDHSYYRRGSIVMRHAGYEDALETWMVSALRGCWVLCPASKYEETCRMIGAIMTAAPIEMPGV